MKFRSLLFVCMLLAPVAFAQRGDYDRRGGEQGDRGEHDEASTLSIYSDGASRFFLVLNGVKQNVIAQSKIRVEGLPKYDNDIELFFEDNSPAIHRRINIADPIDGKAINLTLKVERNQRGFTRLKFHKSTELDHNYHRERDEYVMSYGQPKQINTVTETTYTDPNTGQVVTQTTTTTTNSNGYGNNGYGNNNNYTTVATPPPPPPPAPMAMDPQTFSEAKQSISAASFDDTKLSTAKTILTSNNISTAQVMEICQLFSFENSKVDFAKFAYSKTVDKNNYYKVGSIFDFDSDKKVLNDFISRGGR